jgi:tRNA U34 5-methylaminomethyl-2-thiouridine-forming methyltransferase MnmC
LFAFTQSNEPIQVLEIGFGTGLNALLTAIEANNYKRKVVYYTLEPFPIEEEFAIGLNYGTLFENKSNNELFRKIHLSKWNCPVVISDYFTLIKFDTSLEQIDFGCSQFHVVYFDAFGPDKQPELWSEELFAKIARNLVSPAILTTYSTKGDVKRGLKNVGFKIEKLAGPPGKREVLRAMLVPDSNKKGLNCVKIQLNESE